LCITVIKLTDQTTSKLIFFEIPYDWEEILSELRSFFNNERENTRIKLMPPDSPGLFVTWRHWDLIKEKYPLLEDFRQRYDLAHLLIFFIMDEVWWDDHPHSHNTKTGGSILWPIYNTTADVTTQFYQIIEPNKIRYPGDSDRYDYLEYSGTTNLLGEFHLIDRPWAIDVNVFHKPVLLTADTNKVNGRTICNWKAKGEVDDLARMFGVVN
jgi:hypothetical protein